MFICACQSLQHHSPLCTFVSHTVLFTPCDIHYLHHVSSDPHDPGACGMPSNTKRHCKSVSAFKARIDAPHDTCCVCAARTVPCLGLSSFLHGAPILLWCGSRACCAPERVGVPALCLKVSHIARMQTQKPHFCFPDSSSPVFAVLLLPGAHAVARCTAATLHTFRQH